jgi:protein-arginine kinase activator protein McsA
MNGNKVIDALRLSKADTRRLKKILKEDFNGDITLMLDDIERMVVNIEHYEGAALIRDLKNELKRVTNY